MHIIKIEANPICTPMRQYGDSYADYSKGGQFVLVKIETDEGIIGYGEAPCTPASEFYGDTFEGVTSCIRNYLSPKLLHEDPLNIRKATMIMNRAQGGSTLAKTGIDLALYDIAGKALGVQTCTLLGGIQRESIEAASEITISKPNEMVKEARRLLNLGFRAIKVKAGRDVEDEIKGVRAVRETVGNEIDLSVDPNGGWSRSDALKALKAFTNLEIKFVEQPLPGWDLEGLAWLRKKTDIPIMVDESVWKPHDVIKIAQAEAADFINIKIEKTGGLKNAVDLYTTARAVGMQCMVGNECESGIAIAAKLHLAASLEDLPIACEFTELSYQTIVIKDALILEKGRLKLPKGSGMGVTLNMKLIEKYKVPF